MSMYTMAIIQNTGCVMFKINCACNPKFTFNKYKPEIKIFSQKVNILTKQKGLINVPIDR